METADAIIEMTRQLADAFDEIDYETKPLGHIYNPFAYAFEPCRAYIEKFAHTSGKRALFVGMNPGPWGMAQTGVPFGDVVAVRDWMEIREEVGQPDTPLESRPIEGFDLERREVSGTRLWGWAEARWGAPEAFFEECFVWNYCPLMFLDTERARNRTPNKLYKADREQVFPPCDEALTMLVETLEPEWVIGVGAFAHRRAKKICKALDGPRPGRILHPSPASPKANRGWRPQAEAELDDLGVHFDNWLATPLEDAETIISS